VIKENKQYALMTLPFMKNQKHPVGRIIGNVHPKPVQRCKGVEMIFDSEKIM